jgi:predicted nucleic acid-binding protein
MTLAQLRTGEAVFVDANIFVFHFAPDPQFQAACSQLLLRIETQDLAGFTSTPLLSEVAHRLMTTEARQRFGWTGGKVARRLKQNPALCQSLTGFRMALENVLQSRTQVLAIAPALLLTAATLSVQHGLLANDALIVAVMQQHGLTNLASADADFDRVPGLTRYAPV